MFMGAGHATRVYVDWPDLPDKAFRLLVHMALTAKDSHTEPTYCGGREALAMALGLPPGDKGSHQSVKRAVRALVDAGAVSRVLTGYAGKRSEYRIHFPERGSESDPQRGSSTAPQRGSESDPLGGQKVTQRGSVNDPPRTTRRTEENKEEVLLPSKSPSRRANAAERQDESKATRLQLVRARADAEAAAREGA